jgi:Fe-S cluster assembly protein SufD
MSEQAFFTALQSQLEERTQDPLKTFRAKSFQKLTEMGLPSRSHEAFRYVPLREFYLSSFQPATVDTLDRSDIAEAVLPECQHSHLVFVNGSFSLELSDITALPKQIILSSLKEASLTHGSFLQSYLTRTLKEEKDPFALINLALHESGAFMYLPPKLEVEPLLQWIYVTTGKESQLALPRIHMALGAHSQLRTVITHYKKGAASSWTAPALELSLEEGADLSLFQFPQEETAWQFESMRAQLKKNAKFQSLSLMLGAKAVRQSYRIELQGENSEVHLNGLSVLGGGNTAHTHATVEHQAPHTRSMQKFKGILADHSQSSFEGKIFVCPEAQKTEAYQVNHNLLLSQGAIAYSKPNLEIFADDVKASHGATISQLDEEQLFYLKARGIKPEAAKRLLTQGFCREMINQIPYDSLLQKWDHILQQRID